MSNQMMCFMLGLLLLVVGVVSIWRGGLSMVLHMTPFQLKNKGKKKHHSVMSGIACDFLGIILMIASFGM